MSDEVIVCADCRVDFVFTASEAAFFASKGLTKPRRCKACRQKRRDAKPKDVGGAPPVGSPPSHGERKTQWIGGGEAEPSRRFRNKDRSRRRDRHDGPEY